MVFQKKKFLDPLHGFSKKNFPLFNKYLLDKKFLTDKYGKIGNR